MDDLTILTGRIQALIQELDIAKRKARHIDLALRKRMQYDFLDLFKKHQDTLIGLQQELRSDQPTLEECWFVFLDTRRICEHLFREYLALIQGSLARRAMLDDGLCEIADVLLKDLSRRAKIPWDRFSIIAGEELIHIYNLPEIVRIRFPGVNIWNLPIAAHEFGHFVGHKLEEKKLGGEHYHPFLYFLKKVCGQDKKCSSFLHELFADLFATYSMGMSYACTCILLRFDPLTAYKNKEKHPCDAKRVYWILEVLTRIGEDEGGLNQVYSGIIPWLINSWEQSLKMVGRPADLKEGLGKETIDQLDKWLEDLYSIVERTLSGVCYRAEDFRRAKKLSHLLDGKEQELDDEYKPADVLNAAWWGRIHPGGGESDQIYRTGDRAMKLLTRLGGVPDD